MNPKIVTRDPVKIAGYLHKTSMEINTIPAFWQEIMADGRHEKLQSQPWVQSCADYGACFMLNDNEMEYLVGLEVKDGGDVSAEFTAREIDGGLYAVFAVPPGDHCLDFAAGWQKAGQWIEETQEYIHTVGGVDFELYKMDDDKLTCDIYIAVAKK